MFLSVIFASGASEGAERLSKKLFAQSAGLGLHTSKF